MPHREPSISAFWTRVAVAADALPRARPCSAAIELLLGGGESVEDDGFGRVGAVCEEFRQLLALVGSETPPSTQLTVLSCAWAPR